MSEADRVQDGYLAFFEKTRWRGLILKAICRDAIAHSLAAITGPYSNIPVFEASTLLDKAFGSDAIWGRARSVMTCNRAADGLAKMSDDDFEAVQKLLFDLDNNFAWSCVRETVRDDIVSRSLVTCALFVSKAEDSSAGAKETAAALGEAAGAVDKEKLKEWTWAHDYSWSDDEPEVMSRTWTIQRIACRLTKWFDPIREDW